MTRGVLTSTESGFNHFSQASLPVAGFVLLGQLAVLYLCGSYASSRALGMLSGLSGPAGQAGGFGQWAGRGLFYALVLPGVVLHESAHYLACVATRTRVARFAPFSPTADGEGRIILGYVAHEKRSAPIMAAIGLAPMVLNPAGILIATILLTPLSPTALADSLADAPRAALGALWESGFVAASPVSALLWGYLLISFAVGSVPSREDLRSVPAALLLVAMCAAAIALLRGTGGVGMSFPTSASYLAQQAIVLYTLPVMVAILAASVTAVFRRISNLA